MQYLKSFPLWNVVLGGRESEGKNESNTANQFTADNICYKLFLLCGRLTNSRWKRWRGRVSEALPMWQAISGLRVISVPYSRQLASHAWLLHARRSMPTDGFLFPFPRRSEISHLNSEVQRRKLIQRKKNSCVVFSSSQCFARSVCSDQEALMGNFWVQARQAGSADAEQEVNIQCFIAIPHLAHTESHSSWKSSELLDCVFVFKILSLTVIWFQISRFTCVPCSRVHANLVSCISQASGHFLYLLFCLPVVLTTTKLKAISVVFVTFYWGSIEEKTVLWSSLGCSGWHTAYTVYHTTAYGLKMGKKTTDVFKAD